MCVESYEKVYFKVFIFQSDYFYLLDSRSYGWWVSETLINEEATSLLLCHVLRIMHPLQMTQNILKINTLFCLGFFFFFF